MSLWITASIDVQYCTAQQAVPSLSTASRERGPVRVAANSRSTSPANPNAQSLPNAHGQVWRTYDIRPFTNTLVGEPRPEQTIVDWILRETGTEAWFSQPAGMLDANRNRLRVYHTPAIQRTVEDIVNRFVHGDSAGFVYGVRMVTVESPNWRSWAYQRLQSVPVQTPGVDAWLVAKEDAAVILTELRKRSDFREHSSPNMLIHNARTQEIRRMHPMAYVKSITSPPARFGTALQTPAMGQVEQGFLLNVSPLLSADGRTVDAIIKLETNQVEKLSSVPIIASAPNVTSQNNVSIQVPQTSSWRLHERFRWPIDRVLLIGCGVVAAPTPQPGAGRSFLGNLSGNASRVEALLFLEAKGEFAGTGTLTPSVASGNHAGRYRGRY